MTSFLFSSKQVRILLLFFFSFRFLIAQSQQPLPVEITYDASGNRTCSKVLRLESAQGGIPYTENSFFTEALGGCSMKIYPNPTQRHITIVFDNNKDESPGTLRLYDSNGRLLRESVIDSDTLQLDLGKYPSGIYIVEIVGTNGRSKWKIVKR